MQSQMPGVRTGRVTAFSPAKGFGFIEDTKTKALVFVHHSSLAPLLSHEGKKNLWVGEYVNFILLPDKDGRIGARRVTGVHGGPLMFETREDDRRRQSPQAPARLPAEGHP